MPFRSAAQRKFLYSQHPDIAKRWAAEHGNKIVPSIKRKLKNAVSGSRKS